MKNPGQTYAVDSKTGLSGVSGATKTLTQAKPSKGHNVHDVVIIGSGPAALTAAIYTTRDDIDTVVVEKDMLGGVPATIDLIENYPGFPEGVTGLDLADRLQKQAERFGAKIELAEVTGIEKTPQHIRVATADGYFYARAVLIATGCGHKKLGVPGEAKYLARGVHYCATCDGAFYRDKNLVVAGGGNSAIQEALYLTRFAKHIDLLVRSTIKADDILVHKLAANKQISVHLHTVTDEIVGDDKGVAKVVATNVKEGKKVSFTTDGVFVFVGQSPNTGFCQNCGIKFDEAGFIQTDARLQTCLKGVFAAGDVRSGATMQIIAAAGEGATAAISIREYLHHAPALNYKNISK